MACKKLKYLLSGFLQKKFDNPWSRGTQKLLSHCALWEGRG